MKLQQHKLFPTNIFLIDDVIDKIEERFFNNNKLSNYKFKLYSLQNAAIFVYLLHFLKT